MHDFGEELKTLGSTRACENACEQVCIKDRPVAKLTLFTYLD